MSTTTLKSKIASALEDKDTTCVLLGGKGCGALNDQGLNIVFARQEALTRTSCIQYLKDLSEDELGRLPVRIAKVPNNVPYEIQVVDGTEHVVLHAANVIELKPNPAVEMFKYCCGDPYPMQGPNKTLICGRCSTRAKIVE